MEGPKLFVTDIDQKKKFTWQDYKGPKFTIIF